MKKKNEKKIEKDVINNVEKHMIELNLIRKIEDNIINKKITKGMKASYSKKLKLNGI